MNIIAQKRLDRDERIDILKGIGICLMVLGHSGIPCTHFIYLFHMPMFFISAGYVFNSKYINSLIDLKQLVFKRVKSLYVPYCLFNIFFILFHNLFVRIHIYNQPKINFLEIIKKIIKTVLFIGGREELGGATWFLRCLFWVTILVAFNSLVLKRITQSFYFYFNLLIGFFFFCIAFFMSIKHIEFHRIEIVLATYILFIIGWGGNEIF